MLLANSLAILILGRDWRLSEDSEAKSNAAYIKIMSWFLDSNSSPYSIHRISLQGNQYDKKVGEWFGPNTISFVLKSLITSHPASNLNCHVCPDGVLYKDQMQTALSTNSHTSLTTISPSTTNSPVLILIPLRLGIETLNPVYVPALLKCFEIRQCVGVAGGKPNSSLFFVGAEMSTGNLFYLDPHYNRPAVEIKDLSSYKLQDFSTYHCQIIRTVSIHRIDPSLVLGFLIKDLQDFEEFCKIVEPITSGKTPLFTIGDTEPDYSQNDLLVLSDDEDDFM
ncbi:Cysteine protease atg4 [Nowakowskiella sp. JEL0407]|nr:Cysteine protease atg4 [Nowakowskiella sp. JEL0407]